MNDGNGGTTTAVATITVDPYNDAPVLLDDTYTTTEDIALGTSLGVDDLLFNDTDPEGDSLTINTTPVREPRYGAVVINGDGTFTYTPDPNFNGTDHFDYEVDDGNGGVSIARATINVTAQQDPADTNDETYTTTEDVTLNADSIAGLLANDIDPDGDLLSVVTSPLSPPTNGIVILNADGSFTYTPDPDFNGVDSFDYEVFDGTSNVVATATINVTAVNDLPEATGASSHSRSLQFSGPRDYVFIGRGAGDNLAIAGDLTVEFWVNATQTSVGETVVGFVNQDVGSSGNNLYQIDLIAPADGNVDVRYRHQFGSNSFETLIFDTNLNLDAWYHLAIERDVASNEVTLYIDGVAFQTQSYTNDPSGGSLSNLYISPDAAIGALGIAAFKGMIDELRVWDSVRGNDAIANSFHTAIADPGLESNLAGYWTFDHFTPEGEFFDLTPNDQSAFVGSGMPFDGFAPVAEFDGTDQINTLGSVSFSDHSVEFWAQPADGSPAAMALFATDDAASGYALVERTATGHILVSINDGSSTRTLQSSQTLPDGMFTHIAYTYEDGAITPLRLYIDGIEDGAATPAGGGSTFGLFRPVRIGGDESGNASFEGTISDFRLWSDVRHSAEIFEFHAQRLLGVEADLQMYYRLDEAEGISFVPDAAGSNDGSVSGDVFLQRSPVLIGLPAGAIDFDGAADGLNAGRGPGDDYALTGDVTIEAWVKLDTAGINPIVSFQGPGIASNDNVLYELAVNAGGDIVLLQENATNVDTISGGPINTNLQTGQWYHVAAVRDAGNQSWEVLINGTVAGSVGFSAAPTGGLLSNLLLGTDGTDYLDGQLFDVRIWNAQLSADEIRETIALRVANDAEGLVFNAGLDDDQSGLANPAVAVGDALTLIGAPIFLETAPDIFGAQVVSLEDTRITGQVHATDVEPGAITYSLDTPADNGSVSIDADGSFTYTPDVNFGGVDSFVYGFIDVDGAYRTDTVQVVVQSEDHFIRPPAGLAIDFHDEVSSAPGGSAIVADHTPTQSLDSFTVSFWMQLGVGGNTQAIVNKSGGPGINYRIEVEDGNIVASFDDGSSTAVAITAARVDDEAWHHVSVVHDAAGDTLSVYLDGVQDVQESTLGIIPATVTDPLVIGDTPAGESPYNGSLYDLRIYADVRSGAEIQQDILGNQGENDSDLILWYQFDNTVYPLVIDQSGDANHGLSDGFGTFDTEAPLGLVDTTTPGAPITISGISITDIDHTNLSLEIRVDHGTVELTNTGGLSIDSEDDLDGIDGVIRLFDESPAALTGALLSSIVYTPDQDFVGTDTLTISADSGVNEETFVLPLGVASSTVPETPGALTYGNALHFDGQDDYASGGDVFDPLSGDLTVELWVDLSDRDGGIIAAKGASAGEVTGWSVELTSDNELIVFASDGTIDAGQKLNIADDSGWHHVALVIDRTTDTIRGFFDGSNDDWEALGLGDSLVGMGAIDTVDDFTIGAGDSGLGAGVVVTRPFLGAVDEVRVWDVARTDGEIAGSFDIVVDMPGIEPNLVGYYKFDQLLGADQIDDHSSTEANLTLGSVITGPSDNEEPALFGYPGRVVDFDGIDDVFDAGRGPGDILAQTGDVTVEFWMQLSDTGTAMTMLEFAGPTTGGPDNVLYRAAVDATGDLIISHRSTGNVVHANDFDTNLQPDVWYHVAFVRNGLGHQVFVDGVSATANTAGSFGTSPDVGTNSKLYIGGTAAGTEFFDGKLSDVRIWDEARAPGDIQNNLHGLVDYPNANLIANFLLNDAVDGSATQVTDFVNGIVGNSTSPVFLEIAAPVGADLDTFDALPGVPLYGRIIGSDAESDVSYQLDPNGHALEGTVSVSADGSFIYTADPGTVASDDSFVVQITDAAGDTNTATVDINVDVQPVVASLTSTATGIWDVTTTWTPSLVPTASDDVEIISPHAVTQNNGTQFAGTVSLVGGTLTVDQPLTVTDWMFADISSLLNVNAALSFGSKLTLESDLNWNGSDLNGPTILALGDVNGTAPGIHTLNSQLILEGSTATLDGPIQGSGELIVRGGGTAVLTTNTAGAYQVGINNRAAGSVTFTAPATPAIGFSFSAGASLLNAGIMVLDDIVADGFGVTISLGGDTLINEPNGIVRTTGTADTRQIDGDFDNRGLLDVDYDLTINTEGPVFDNSGGTVQIPAGVTLEFDSGVGTGTVRVDAGSRFEGDAPGNEGTVLFTGPHTLDLLDDFYLTGTIFDLANGAVTFSGSGSFFLMSDLVLVGSDETFNVHVVNNGTLTLEARSSLDVVGTFNSGLTNNSLLILDDVSVNSATLIVSGGLFNQGTIQSLNTGGGSTGARVVDAEVTNEGVFDIDRVTSVTNAGRTFDTSNGAIDLRGGVALTINDGTTRLGAGTVLAGNAGSNDVLQLTGTHTLELGTGFVFDTSAALDLAGAVTVTGDTWTNASTLVLYGSDDVFNVPFVNDDTLRIEGRSSNHAHVNFNAGFTNNGLVSLDDLAANNSNIVVSGGDLQNTGLLRLDNGGGSTGTRDINAQVVNQGTIELFENGTVLNAGRVFDTSDGTIDVTSDHTLTIDEGTTLFGPGTVILSDGTSGDVLRLAGIHTLQINPAGYSHETDAVLDLAGAVTVSGGDFENNAEFVIYGSDDLFTDTFVNYGETVVEGRSSLNAAATFNAGLSNFGTLRLDDEAANNADLVVTGGDLQNYGLIRTANVSGGSTGSRDITAQVVNHGTIEVDRNAQINNAGFVFDTTEGTIDLSSGQTLTVVDGVTEFGTETRLLGGSGVLSLTGTPELNLVNTYHHGGRADLAFNGVVTVSGADFINEATFVGFGADDVFATRVVNDDLFLIEARSSLDANLVFEQGFENRDLLKLDDLAANNATITVQGAGLHNEGVLLTLNTGTGSTGDRTVVGDLINDGKIDADSLLTVNGLLDTESGTVDVSDAGIRANGTTIFGAGTQVIGGSSSDQLLINGNLLISDEYRHFSDADLNLEGAVTILGGNFINDSELVVYGNDDTFDVYFENLGRITVEGRSTLDAAVTFQQGLTNHGSIILDDQSVNSAQLTVSGGRLFNSEFGEIETDNDGGGSTGSRVIDAVLDNHGRISPSIALTLNDWLINHGEVELRKR